MKNKSILFILLIVLLFVSCGSPSSAKPANEDNPQTVKTPSIIGKWYYNSEDDRYYFNFKSDGTVVYQYYQNLSSSQTSALNTFVNRQGHWSYLNSEKTKFSVGWDDSVDCWYDIISEDDEKLVVSKDSNGPAGIGLSGVTNLLKTAKKVIYTVPEEIADLMGTWYYNSSKEGRSLKFQNDGKCYYTYYVQNGGAVSSLDGWHSANGVWRYSTGSNKITITMHGEASYTYDIIELTSTTFKFQLSENNPNHSMIYTTSQLYK